VAKSSVHSKKPKRIKKKGLKIRRKATPPQIVIDQEVGLVFRTEADLLRHFQPQIAHLEAEFFKIRSPHDDAEEKVQDMEDQLELTLDEPFEIWHDRHTFPNLPLFIFLRPMEGTGLHHLAICYVNQQDEPTFVFLHFCTTEAQLLEHYRRGELVYDRSFEEIEFGAIDGDALTEGDPLAVGMFASMMKVRGDKDVSQDDFKDIGEECREDTIENGDEIWRSTDLNGNQIVTFIKAFPDSEISDLHYLAVTQEDASSQVHSLLFSFPTSDISLVDRYRRGENLQAEEVVQESSH
jgi:hypothetical protein